MEHEPGDPASMAGVEQSGRGVAGDDAAGGGKTRGRELDGEGTGAGSTAVDDKSTRALGPAGALWWGLLLLILLVVAGIRWRILDAPLERDEGEYAVFAQFLLEGVPPYAQAVNMKLPGIYAIYAGILAVFGESARGIHLGLLVANLLSGLLVAILARRIFRHGGAGLAAAATYLVFTLGPRLQGPWANAEAFLLPFVLLAGLLLVKALESERRVLGLVLTGLALGCSVMVKQHAAFFCVAAGLILVGWHLARKERSLAALTREALILIGATLIPYGLTLGVLASSGVFERFWFWTWEYARSYTGQYGVEDLAENLALRGKGILYAAWPLVLLAAAGIVAALARREHRAVGAALLALAVLTFAAISVGFVYRPHYFQLCAPVVALGCGALAASMRAKPAKYGVFATLGLALLYVPFEERVRLFRLSPAELTATVYPGNGFEAMPEVGEYLAELVPEGERFAVIGSEPELYFYADRRPATSYVYTYALMELQPFAEEMHGEMAEEIEGHQPDVLVIVYTPTSWLQRPESETYIQSWAQQYLYDRFELVGTLLNGRTGPVLFRMDEVGSVRPPREAVLLEIYQRRGA